jgi:hypothetical protein
MWLKEVRGSYLESAARITTKVRINMISARETAASQLCVLCSYRREEESTSHAITAYGLPFGAVCAGGPVLYATAPAAEDEHSKR